MSGHQSLRDWVLDHPKLAGFTAAIALAVTFSPRVSPMASWVSIVIAAIFAIAMLFGVSEKAKLGKLFPWIASFVTLSLLVGFGLWLTGQKSELAPDLKWSFGIAHVGEIQRPDNKPIVQGGSTILVMGTVSNAGGMPSTVKSWRLSVRLPDERQVRNTDLVIFRNATEVVSGIDAEHAQTLDFKKDYFPDITVNEPILPGHSRPGFVIFALRGVPKERIRVGTVVTLCFNDVRDEKYCFDLPFSQQFHEMQSIPGLSH